MIFLIPNKVNHMAVSIKKMNDILPQIHCKKCGYEDCYEYSRALLNGEKHNLCLPGGEKVMNRLSFLLKKEPLKMVEKRKRIFIQSAKIQENLCIGCKKCLDICPVDAVCGTQKSMHTIISSKCNGCKLCINACPMNCIKVDKDSTRLLTRSKKKMYQKLRENKKNRLQNEKKTLFSKIDKNLYIQKSLTKFNSKIAQEI